MRDAPQPSLVHASSMATGWVLSCLVHGGVALATVLFVQRIHLAPQGDPFHWNVAMIAAPSPSVQAHRPAEPVTSPTKHSPSSVRPVQRRESTSVATAPLATELPPPSQHVESLPIESRALQPIPAEPAHPSSQPVPSPEQASVPLTDSSQSLASPADLNSSASPSHSMDASLASVSSQQSSPADHAWLATLMAQWIEGLDKHYPAALRADGITGKVTLIALLHKDGSLSDVRITKSSGHVALDRVALEDVSNGPPVTLTHPLERPQIAVKFSISYDLKSAR